MGKKKKPAKDFPVLIEVRDSTGAKKRSTRTTSLEEFTEDIERQKLNPARVKKQLAGQIPPGDSKRARELQKKAAEERRQVTGYADTRSLGDKSVTWAEYWKEIYNGLPSNQKFKKTADQRTAKAFGRSVSTIKRRRLRVLGQIFKDPDLSKL